MHRRIATLMVAFHAANPASPLARQHPDTGCVKQSELALGPIRLDAPLYAVREKLGRPLTERHSSREDDGGQYDVLQLNYRMIEIDIGRGQRVYRCDLGMARGEIRDMMQMVQAEAKGEGQKFVLDIEHVLEIACWNGELVQLGFANAAT